MPFEPGKSGNPAGTQKFKPFWAALNRAIAQDDAQRLRTAAEKLLDFAAQGEGWAIAMLADRLDGKPSQAVTGPDDGPIQQAITVEFVKSTVSGGS